MLESSNILKLEGSWAIRNARMKELRNLLRFATGTTKEGFEETVLNEAKVLYYTCVGLLSGQFPKIALPTHFDATEEDKTKMSKAERFLQGIIRQLDENHLNTGYGQWLREFAYWICSGWITIFAYIDEVNEFHAEFFDPMTIYPRWTNKGLREVARIAQIPSEEATALAEEWELPLPRRLRRGTQVRMVNYWEKRLITRGKYGVFNTILFDGREIKLETQEDFEEIPIIIGLANGSPEQDDASEWQRNLGQAVTADNRLMYGYQNRWLSMLMQIIADTAYPPIRTASASGEAIIGKDDLGSAVVIPTKIGEEIATIQYAGAPIEVNTLLSIITGCTQRGGLPYVIYGGLPFELSGFAISQLMAAIQYKVSPYMKTMEQTLAKLCRFFIEQFRLKGKTVELSVATKPGQFFVEEFNKSDIPLVRFVEVTIPRGTPQDKMQQILTARQALQPPAVLSRETLWEDFMDIEDIGLEKKRISEDLTADLPVVKLLEVAENMRKQAANAYARGDVEGTRILLGYAQVIINQLSATAKGQQTPQGEGALPGSAGQGFRQGRITPEQQRAARVI